MMGEVSPYAPPPQINSPMLLEKPTRIPSNSTSPRAAENIPPDEEVDEEAGGFAAKGVMGNSQDVPNQDHFIPVYEQSDENSRRQFDQISEAKLKKVVSDFFF